MKNTLKQLMLQDKRISKDDWTRALSPLFYNSAALSRLFMEFFEEKGDCLTQQDVCGENVYTSMTVALENGMDPNDVIPYTDDDTGGDALMWTVAGLAWQSNAAPKLLKLLLDFGGDPNLLLGDGETVFHCVDDFFWTNGEALEKSQLRCWLLLAAYGGDQNNREFLPLRMLGNHQQEELRAYERYDFLFESVAPNTYKRDRVLFIVETESGEKVAVNETPFG